MNELPYIDTQTVTVRVPAAVVFETIERLVPRIARGRFASAYARLVGAADLGVDHGPVGFHVVHSAAPSVLVLRGEHRFSVYELAFRIEGYEQSVLSADTNAAFPGPLGRAYRTAVIGSGAHRIVVWRLLSEIKRRAEDTPSDRADR